MALPAGSTSPMASQLVTNTKTAMTNGRRHPGILCRTNRDSRRTNVGKGAPVRQTGEEVYPRARDPPAVHRPTASAGSRPRGALRVVLEPVPGQRVAQVVSLGLVGA